MLEALWRFFANEWRLIFLIVTWVGIAGVAIRNRRDWKRKRLTQQVNFSLIYIESGTLMLRTLLEESAEQVWLNAYGVKQVRRAAERTTEEQPFIRFHSEREMDHINRAVLNVLSERFSVMFLGQSLRRAGICDRRNSRRSHAWQRTSRTAPRTESPKAIAARQRLHQFSGDSQRRRCSS